ncbi:helix-turn-helix domain-containing protein [Arcicella sp. LKC2W]|uniref:helix-turn-helix domain-containing protein n=1 Tax=Arcicella sp. LKC2W TaxID=2984198 RepID=UPI002B20BAF5|nr:helix-turn-helix domain-containing protein [Arcicella sp. LKC2W]MEA5459587.1 helix-turn-helix domain-containing protein [Arcicella sp. LKC2W]
MKPTFQSNSRLELADQYVRFTNKNVFLTGKAGTGKTTFLKNIKAKSPKRIVIVAPTGVAAINAGGVTIHSFFQLSFGPNIPDNKPAERRISNEKIKAIKAIDLLVIDEISMVRADVLDAIDEVLRRYRNRNLPFGGVQLLMIGDLHQLSPVIKEDEWDLLRPYYQSVYFFESKALAQSQFITIELTHIFRQADEQFIDLLNKVRDKKLDADSTRLLNSRYIPNFQYPDDEKYITLTSHNRAAANINAIKLSELKGKTYTFTAEITDDFPESMYPNELNLELKVGAQVMFVKNDSNLEKRYFNGKLGEITDIDEELIWVKCPNEKELIIVSKVSWDNIKYVLDDSKTMQEHTIGTFSQFPIKTAWAITIHKSQGLTFDRAIIDAASSFAHGQVYVALSRCKTFEGLVLSTPITPESVKSDSTIAVFDQEADKQDLSDLALVEAKKRTQSDWILDLFDFKAVKIGLHYLHQNLEPVKDQFANSTFENVTSILENYNVEIDTIIEKFRRQLEFLMAQTDLPEENEELQERIKKGSVYIANKLQESAYNTLKNIDLACDNKETRNNVSKLWEQSLKNTFEKLMLLKSNQQGFDSTLYLTTKANITLDFEAEKARLFRSQKTTETSGSSTDLFNLLRVWRDSVANDKNIEKYMVLAQKALQSLADEMPRNKANLAKISGLGKIKVQQFGDEILDIINEFCETNGIETSNIVRENKPVKKAIVKGSTHELSYNYFKEGKTITQIAEIRNLSASTIEGHLGEFVKKGLLEVSDIMDNQKIKTIREFMLENPDLKGSALKEALGADYSYGEIRLVGASIGAD